MSGFQTRSVDQSPQNRWITNPKHIPLFVCPGTSLNNKSDSVTINASSVAAFFTVGAREGASASISVADTYATICDLTGSGFMGSCVSPSHTADFTPTIRITVDGQVYTFTSSGNITSAFRMVLGAFTPGAVTITTSGGGDKTSSLQDYGFAGAKVGGLPRLYGSPNINPPTLNLAEGLPMLRFETGLKVEIKASLLSADPEQLKCLVTYRMDM